MNTSIIQKIQKSKAAILAKTKFNPTWAIVAGSGLGGLKDHFTVVKSIKYCDIPYFAKTTVAGHGGELFLCTYKGIDLLVFNGRFHYYEGHAPNDIVYPTRVMNSLGVKNLILTAAGGGVNPKYKAQDIVLLTDHINFTGNNPLIGQHHPEFGERFPSMGEVYDKNLRKLALKIAKKNKTRVHEGVYVALSGPDYETPATVKMIRMLGADICGMSVVYEAIAAAQMKMKILGLTYASNMAQGVGKKEILNHKDVLKAGQEVGIKMTKIIKEIIR